jgi:hypothetical protein
MIFKKGDIVKFCLHSDVDWSTWNPDFIDDCKEKNFIFIVKECNEKETMIDVHSDKTSNGAWHFYLNDMRYDIEFAYNLPEELFKI